LVRVLLIAPSPALRAGLRSMLATDREIQVVGERSQWSEEDTIESEADVMITTSASLSPLMGRPPLEVPVLYLRDEPLSLEALDSEAAWGMLPQDASAGELCAAVHALAQGLVVGTRQLLYSSENTRTDHGPLTAREAEVLELLARGLANKQIAVELGISEHTVKFHISSIYTKLNATNRTQAVREGLRNGWILL
jgi:DNA-binding NarL/FixJ family response regulator